MPKYRFAVRSKEGKLRTGSVTEVSMDSAKERLKSAGFVIVSLTEEAELVILEAKAPGGATKPKTERAAIIEFETTFGERIGSVFSRFILRKEFAMVLFALGAGWATYQNLNRPKPVAPIEAKYLPMAVEIQVEAGGLTAQGGTFEAVLPDIPLRFGQPVSDGNLLKYSFEALKQPGRVQVSLLDSSKAVVGEGDGLLSIRQGGTLTGTVPLSPVKKKKP
jgi:hypothetical protein